MSGQMEYVPGSKSSPHGALRPLCVSHLPRVGRNKDAVADLEVGYNTLLTWNPLGQEKQMPRVVEVLFDIIFVFDGFRNLWCRGRPSTRPFSGLGLYTLPPAAASPQKSAEINNDIL